MQAKLLRVLQEKEFTRVGGDKDKDSAMEAARQEKRTGYQTKYLLACTKCGKEIVRYRRSKVVLHPEKYRCKCGGEIKHKR